MAYCFPSRLTQLKCHHFSKEVASRPAMDKSAAVYLSAVMEYLTVEMFESVNDGLKEITVDDLQSALMADADLKQLVKPTLFDDGMPAQRIK